jgi:toxin FitB
MHRSSAVSPERSVIRNAPMKHARYYARASPLKAPKASKPFSPLHPSKASTLLAHETLVAHSTCDLVFLIDTNIISEVRKGVRCDQNVAAWFANVRESEIFLSVLVLGEIRKGIELARHNDPPKADALGRWLQRLETEFGERILPVDTLIADEWGRMSAVRPIPVIDGLLGATSKVYGLTFATRDNKDLDGLGVNIMNPFMPSAPTK